MKTNNWWFHLWIVCVAVALMSCAAPAAQPAESIVVSAPESHTLETFDASIANALKRNPEDVSRAILQAQNSRMLAFAESGGNSGESIYWNPAALEFPAGDHTLLAALALDNEDRPYLAVSLGIAPTELDEAIDRAVYDYAEVFIAANSALQEDVELSLANRELRTYIEQNPIDTIPSLTADSSVADIINAYVTGAVADGIVPDQFGDLFKQLPGCGNDLSFDPNGMTFEFLPGIGIPSCFPIPSFPEEGEVPPVPPCTNCYGGSYGGGLSAFTPVNMPASPATGGEAGQTYADGEGYKHRRSESVDCGRRPRFRVTSARGFSITVYVNPSRVLTADVNASQAYSFCGWYERFEINSSGDYRVDSTVEWTVGP